MAKSYCFHVLVYMEIWEAVNLVLSICVIKNPANIIDCCEILIILTFVIF